ncbi:MAG: 2OG-Fe(II) oxygenase [Rubrivivax sp.]
MSTTQPTTRSTPVQQITPELRRWIIAQAEAGCLPEDVVKAMVASGWHEDVALDAMEQTLRGHLAALRQPVPGGSTVPEPNIDEGTNVIVVEGHAVEVVMTLRLPRVVLFGRLLTDQECDGLMAQAAPRLARSETVDTATGDSEVHAARTSDGMFFERGETPLIDRIERRIAALVNWPLERGEGLQILRYGPGAQYKPHNDYFDPEQPGTPRILERGGQRVGTLVMYLNTPERGGATVFPDAGLEVAPVRGSAVFFSYDRPHPVTKTLHGGAPVLAGEKWVATKWLRQGVFV